MLHNGYQSFHTAGQTIRGIEIMHMINKGQVEEISKKDVLVQKKFALVSLWDCCIKN